MRKKLTIATGLVGFLFAMSSMYVFPFFVGTNSFWEGFIGFIGLSLLGTTFLLMKNNQ